jgi:hypothetical protein
MYQIRVNDFSDKGSPEFELAVVVDDNTLKRFVGQLEDGRRSYDLTLIIEPQR